MSTFKITDIYKISGRGHILSGAITDRVIILSGDNIVFKKDFENYIFKITGVTIAREKHNFDIIISSSDFEKISEWEIKGKEFKIVNLSDRRKKTNNPIIWTGDLADDCTAEWAGLMLRAEWMDEDYWWWEVSDMDNPEIEIDSSNNYDTSFIGGDASRQKAEEVARKYLGLN
jgi:signal peptidase I